MGYETKIQKLNIELRQKIESLNTGEYLLLNHLIIRLTETYPTNKKYILKKLQELKETKYPTLTIDTEYLEWNERQQAFCKVGYLGFKAEEKSPSSLPLSEQK